VAHVDDLRVVLVDVLEDRLEGSSGGCVAARGGLARTQTATHRRLEPHRPPRITIDIHRVICDHTAETPEDIDDNDPRYRRALGAVEQEDSGVPGRLQISVVHAILSSH